MGLISTKIKIPVSTLQDYAARMKGFADTNADVFDRLYNSLVRLKESGQWQGLAVETAVDAAEKNKKKFKETIDELQSLALFMEKFADEVSKKDKALKARIEQVE